MKTENVPDGVWATWTDHVRDQNEALGIAASLVKTWESVEPMYQAGKATLPRPTKLRIRRIAVSTIEALEDAKAAFLDAEAWLTAWAKAGQDHLRTLAKLGATVPSFVPSTPAKAPPSMPGGQAVLDLIEPFRDHLAELIWDGDLYDTFMEETKR